MIDFHKTNTRQRWWIVLGAWVCTPLGAACETSSQVASACVDSDCSKASGALENDALCTWAAVDFDVGVRNCVDCDEPTLRELCLPHNLPKADDGLVACELRATFEDDEVTQRNCQEVFQSQVAGQPGQRYCVLHQLDALQAELSDTPGFYYEDEQDDPLVWRLCSQPARLRFAPADLLGAPDYFVVNVHCELSATGTDPEADSPMLPSHDTANSCAPPPQSPAAGDAVGQTCISRTPLLEGSDSRGIYVTHADECGEGVCLSYHKPPFIQCPTPASSGADAGTTPSVTTCSPKVPHTTCSCRCSADDPGTAELCTCPEGFKCALVLRDGPAAGGYCVDERVLGD